MGRGQRQEILGGQGDQTHRSLSAYREAGGTPPHPCQLREALPLHQPHHPDTEPPGAQEPQGSLLGSQPHQKSTGNRVTVIF